MYVLKGKTKICTPLSSQTDEPGNTKNGTDILCPYVTPSAKFGDGRVPGAGALQPPFHVDFGFFSFFSGFFDKPTAKTTEPIFMVDSSKDVILLKEVPLGGLVAVAQKMWAWHPENPQFFAPQCIFPFKKESITMRKPYQIEQKLQRNTTSKVGSNFQNPASLRLPDAP